MDRRKLEVRAIAAQSAKTNATTTTRKARKNEQNHNTTAFGDAIFGLVMSSVCSLLLLLGLYWNL